MINNGQNATPESWNSLAKILQGFQQNDINFQGGQQDNPNHWMLNAIKNAQPINDGLPHATQRTDALNKKAGLYTMNLIGSQALGYPQTGIFNAPNPQNKVKGLLDEY